MEITIDQLKNYLGTGLLVQVGTAPRNLTALQDKCKYAFVTAWIGSREKQMVGIENVKPICYRLSDLDKEIEHNGERFVPIEKLPYGNRLNFYNPINPGFDLEITIGTEDYSQEIDLHDGFKIMLLLFEWHFWPFGEKYFEEGLVIDKMKNVC